MTTAPPLFRPDRCRYFSPLPADAWHVQPAPKTPVAHDGGPDYVCFMLWESARKNWDAIRRELAGRFTLLADYELWWSDKHFKHNAYRLYGNALTRGSSDQGATLAQKMGEAPCRLLLMRDDDPDYSWERSVSGRIEPANRNATAAKKLFRSWSDTRFPVHSSTNVSECMFQCALALGPQRLRTCITEPDPEPRILEKDLEGAGGWPDWRAFFEVLNLCSDYIVMRSFEGLPEKLNDKDLDVLCADLPQFAAAGNILLNPEKLFKGKVRVGGETVPIDIRCIGDGYHDARWLKDLLDRKRTEDGVQVPAKDDYFFSLLYHAAAQKYEIKPEHRQRLLTMARDLEFTWFDAKALDDPHALSMILAGYMVPRGYVYTRPNDRGVKDNKVVTENLPKISGEPITKFRRRIRKARERDSKAADAK